MPILNVSSPTSPSVTPAVTLIPEQIVLGVRFHCLRMPEAVARVAEFIAERTPRQICLSNAYTISLCQTDPLLREVANHSDLNLADGMSIVWGSRWLGSKIPCRVGGPDLMSALCARAEQSGYKIFFMGSTEQNVARLAVAMKRRWPKIQIVGHYCPPMCEELSEAENTNIVNALQQAAPDILFVGLSAPKQEKWIAANLHRIPVPVSLGVGAAFNFISGKVPRAPEWLQRIGFEWLYRLYREPRRLWKRYLLGNAVFLSLLVAAMARDRLTRAKTAPL